MGITYIIPCNPPRDYQLTLGEQIVRGDYIGLYYVVKLSDYITQHIII